MKIRARLGGMKKLFPKAHLTKTSNANRDNAFYVTKDETRVEGPWTDKDEKIYVTRQVKEIEELLPWQRSVIELSKQWDTRHVDFIVDTEGKIGKSVLVGYMQCHKLCRRLLVVRNYQDMMQAVCSMPTAKVYTMDMPRAMSKNGLSDLMSAIETIKDGYAADLRYKFREKNFDCPNIWIFTNKVPPKWMLTEDRWRLWKVVENELVPFTRGVPGTGLPGATL